MKKKHWNTPEGESFSIAQAAKAMSVTRQAVYVALKIGRLAGDKVGGKYWISRDALIAYQKSKYSRMLKKVDGVKLFDGEERFNVPMAAVYMKVPPQRVYYMIRTNRIRHSRHGCAYIVYRDGMDEIMKLAKQKKRIAKRPSKRL